jgi:hypothetical protein
MLDVERLIVQPNPPELLHGAWNEESYLGDKQNLVTQVFGVNIKNVISGHNETRKLLRMNIQDDALVTDVIGPYPIDGFTKPEPVNLDLTRKISRVGGGITATDYYWSGSTRLLYILDGIRAKIYIVDPLDKNSDSLVKEIPIELPAKVDLDERSRLAVLEADFSTPEDLDPYAYVSAPASGAILQIVLQTGVTQIYAGRPGSAEIRQSGKRESPPHLKEPTALIVDQESGRLIIADDKSSSIYGVDRGRKLFRIVSLPPHSQISSLLVYRTNRYIDSRITVPRKFLIEDEAWGHLPAFLLIPDVGNHQVYKLSLHANKKQLARLVERILPGIGGLHDMQNGDLLLLRQEKEALCLHTTQLRLSPGFSMQES